MIYEGSASRRHGEVTEERQDTEGKMPSKGNFSLSWILQGALEHNCT